MVTESTCYIVAAISLYFFTFNAFHIFHAYYMSLNLMNDPQS